MRRKLLARERALSRRRGDSRGAGIGIRSVFDFHHVKGNLAEDDLVAGHERGLGNARAVDQRAVARPKVAHPHFVAIAH
jgi:hypothetical protein